MRASQATLFAASGPAAAEGLSRIATFAAAVARNLRLAETRQAQDELDKPSAAHDDRNDTEAA